MLAEDHASPDDRVVSLPLKTNSTIFETSHFSVVQEHLQNNKDEFRNLQTMLKHIKNLIDSENRKAMLSDIKPEFKHIVESTDINVLQDYLHSVCINFSPDYLLQGDKRSICLFFLIAYHVLVASEKKNSTQILNFINDILLELCNYDFHFYLDCIFQLYLDVYYKDNPNEVFTNIHSIWKSDKATELNLKLAYCKNLIEAKDYKTLIQLIHHHADNFIKSFEDNEHQLCMNSSTAAMVLLHILHHQGSINSMEKVKIIEKILSRQRMSDIWHHDTHPVCHGFYYFLLTLDNKQLMCTPYVIKLLQHVKKEQPLGYLKIILLSSDRLRQANHYTECIKLIKCHFQFISSFPSDELTHEHFRGECYYRQQYCITLLLLLNEYVSCYETHNMDLLETKLLELYSPQDTHDNSCYCFMGNQECMTSLEKCFQYMPFMTQTSPIRSRGIDDFKLNLLYICYSSHCSILTRLGSPFPMEPTELHRDYDLMMNDVIQGDLEQTSYLESILDMMEINRCKNESVASFIEFIERSADYNVASLYNIIKMLCAFELKPEIQSEIEDMILQGVTAYLMTSCNKQFGFLSKLILDINMISPKCHFLHKLTSGIANSLLKFDNDTVKDFNNIIYKCYCTVRHDCRDEKDKNIKKYKDHFTFIASMEAEEQMKKLTSLANLLLLLTLLLIASGGHHKSAELKKYLSLKYEYSDSILYLLWCSGDVEINPGPTLSTLRKVPDSVKERNWIYEMSSMLVRLLKYKSIDIRIDGLWEEWPLDWPVDTRFYDPRNKPKGKGYSIKTDRNLLENLKELCDGKKIFQDITQLKDEHTKSKVKQYKKEITAWRKNKADLFELYILRQELDILLEAKTNLQKYKKEPEIKEGLSALNVDLIYDSEEDMCLSNASYTDIVRDLAITFCRIGKGLNPLQKSDNLWQMPPSGWCRPKKDFFSPCNAGQRRDKCTDKELVQNLLSCCKTKIEEYCTEEKKPVLIKLLNAWKHENVQEVRKYHTIWSNIEVIDHSLKYLKLEGLLAKSQTHLEELGIKPREFKESIQHSTDISSCPIQDKQTNQKCPIIIQSHQENHFDHPVKLRDADASQKVVPLPLMGRKYQETDQTTQNNTNKRKHQSTDENYTEPKKLHKSEKGKPLPVDSSSCKQADNVNKKGETTLGQCVNQILIPFEEQDYSSVVGDSSIPNTSSTTDQQSDLSNELPVYVELYINRIQKRSDTTLIKDIEQLIDLKEQDIDSS